MEFSRSSLLIRADADRRTGTGHVMRCLALAQAWQDAGGKVIFITACESDTLHERLINEGMDVVALSDTRDWPPVASVLAAHHDAWVVLDGYHFDTACQQRFKDAGHRLLVIDDLAQLDQYVADLVLNQNLGAQGLTYVHHPDTQLLRGTDFVLLRREFLSHQETRPEIPEFARRILVTLGGADPDNATLMIVRALQRLNNEGFEVAIAVGASYPYFDDLQTALSAPRPTLPKILQGDTPRGPRFALFRSTSNMPELMAWADIAISAGGTTAWELAFMGVPSLAVVLAPNQQRSVDGLSALGVMQSLGWHAELTEEDIVQAVQQLQDDRDRRQTMSAAGRALVDGFGIRRVMTAMNPNRAAGWLPSDLRLQPVTLADSSFLWRLTNDPTVRATSFSQNPVPYERHVQWLAGKLDSPDTCMWILAIDQEPVAQIRYDRVEPDMAEVGFSVVAHLRGHGFGARLLELTGNLACQILNVRRLRGRLFASNIASARVFIKAGYRLVEEFEINQAPCYAFERSCQS